MWRHIRIFLYDLLIHNLPVHLTDRNTLNFHFVNSIKQTFHVQTNWYNITGHSFTHSTLNFKSNRYITSTSTSSSLRWYDISRHMVYLTWHSLLAISENINNLTRRSLARFLEVCFNYQNSEKKLRVLYYRIIGLLVYWMHNQKCHSLKIELSHLYPAIWFLKKP